MRCINSTRTLARISVWVGLFTILMIGIGTVSADVMRCDPSESARIVFYRDGDASAALALLEKAKSNAETGNSEFIRSLELANIALAEGEILEVQGDARGAKERFTFALSFSRRAVELDKSSSAALCALSSSGMRILPYTDMLYKIRNGFWPKSSAEKALALDSGNGDAFLALGQFYLYCPPFFGGNVEKAQAYFKKFTEASASREVYRFMGEMWQGISFREQKKIDQAEKAFAQAALIYPHSPWLAQEISKTRGSL